MVSPVGGVDVDTVLAGRYRMNQGDWILAGIGRQFALHEAVLALGLVLHRYHLTCVPSIIPEGCCILSGHPKIGKSVLVLAIDERQSAWINQWEGCATFIRAGAPRCGTVMTDQIWNLSSVEGAVQHVGLDQHVHPQLNWCRAALGGSR